MNATGSIVVDTTYGPLASKTERYQWTGGRIVFLCGLYHDIPLEIGKRFRIGPFRLRVAKSEPWHNRIYAIREQGTVNRLLYFVYRATPFLEKIYRRLIVTAYVWGCASYEHSTIPGWRDLRLPWRKRK